MIAEMLLIVRAYSNGSLPIDQVLKLSNGPMRRYVGEAILAAGDAALWAAWRRMIDEICAHDTRGVYVRDRYFSVEDLAAAEATIDYPDGRVRIRLPIRCPWEVAPDPDKGIAGVRKAPVYAPLREDRAGRPAVPEGREWWEPEARAAQGLDARDDIDEEVAF
jgi:hypothetical protein